MSTTITSSIAPAAPSAPAPAPSPSASSSHAVPRREGGFAQLLGEQQGLAAEEPPAAARTPAEEPAAPAAPRRTPAQGRPAVQERRAAKAAETPSARAEGEGAALDAAASAKDEPAAKETADPALADWVSGLQLPPAVAQAPAAAGGVPEDAALAADAQATPAAGPARVRPMGAAPAAAAALPDAPGRAHAPPESPTQGLGSTPAAASARADAQTAMEAAPARQDAPAVAESAAAGAWASALPLDGGLRRTELHAPAPVAATLPTPATAPEFPKALGVQVSVFAREGLQRAELHLNPAEMGPVSIQIAIDGTQAQVNFGADSALTRQVIENGLPELAAALRDAGFTLSGGGVHSQARGRGESGQPARGEAMAPDLEAASVDAGAVAAPRMHRVSAGGVDMYA